MTSAAFHPRPGLRLVGRDDPAAVASWAAAREAREAIVRENRQAAANRTLDPADPRWVLAVRVRGALLGTTLTPERRQHLLRTAERLGVRTFDANLIIAIVQDQARRGEDPLQAAPTLALLGNARPRPGRSWTWLRWAAAIGSAVVANALLIRWLLGA